MKLDSERERNGNLTLSGATWVKRQLNGFLMILAGQISFEENSTVDLKSGFSTSRCLNNWFKLHNMNVPENCFLDPTIVNLIEMKITVIIKPSGGIIMSSTTFEEKRRCEEKGNRKRIFQFQMLTARRRMMSNQNYALLKNVHKNPIMLKQFYGMLGRCCHN